MRNSYYPMRWISLFVLFLLIMTLQACSTSPTLRSPQLDRSRLEMVLHDEYFKLNQKTPFHLPDKAELFALPPELIAHLQQPHIANADVQTRANLLIEMVYGKVISPFTYASEESTIASKTWQTKQGNCISLTMMAYAIGKALSLPIHIQEVRTLPMYERNQQITLISSHVNLVINEPSLTVPNNPNRYGYIVIDFEPVTRVFAHGKWLTEEEVMARFYNNLGAESFMKNQHAPAYAFYKQALTLAPHFSMAYNNLAELYREKNLHSQAQKTWETSLAYNEDNLIALRALVSLYETNGDTTQSQPLKEKIKRIEQADPYYWIAQGLQDFHANRYSLAIRHLEKALSMTKNFSEVHEKLALAYTKTGDTDNAKKHYELLRQLNPEFATSFRLRFLSKAVRL